MNSKRREVLAALAGMGTVFATAPSLARASDYCSSEEIDNSALGQPDFRTHVATYGLVYLLPDHVNHTLETRVNPALRKQLYALGLHDELRTFNMPHITVVHLHSCDRSTPERMLRALPELPPTLNIRLLNFYNTEAAANAGVPWWFDLGVVKNGTSYNDMMAFNTLATAALTPLRDGPLPRCTGPVYRNMDNDSKLLVQRFGVSGVNDGETIFRHNPHTTLVYSTSPYSATINPMNVFAAKMNRSWPRDGLKARLNSASIVEIGFMGNVLREFYRINLDSGEVWEVSSGKLVEVGEPADSV